MDGEGGIFGGGDKYGDKVCFFLFIFFMIFFFFYFIFFYILFYFILFIIIICFVFYFFYLNTPPEIFSISFWAKKSTKSSLLLVPPPLLPPSLQPNLTKTVKIVKFRKKKGQKGRGERLWKRRERERLRWRKRGRGLRGSEWLK